MDLLQLPRQVLELELRALHLPLDAYRTVTGRGGADGPQTDEEQARQATFDGVVGRAKELAGSVLGQDALAREGRLQQAKADSLRKALVKDAVAEQKKAEADAELSERQTEAQQRRTQVARETAQRKAELERQRAAEKARIDREVASRESAVKAKTGRKKALVEQADRSVRQDRAAKVGEATQQEQAATKARNTAAKLDRARTVG